MDVLVPPDGGLQLLSNFERDERARFLEFLEATYRSLVLNDERVFAYVIRLTVDRYVRASDIANALQILPATIIRWKDPANAPVRALRSPVVELILELLKR